MSNRFYVNREGQRPRPEGKSDGRADLRQSSFAFEMFEQPKVATDVTKEELRCRFDWKAEREGADLRHIGNAFHTGRQWVAVPRGDGMAEGSVLSATTRHFGKV
jgi:hypothetical protein